MLTRHTKLIPFDACKEVVGNKDFIMRVTGFASTLDVDRTNEIVEPSAFLSSENFFEKFPVLHVNHDLRWGEMPVGKVTDYLVDERGLMIEAMIAPTPRGQELKTLIELEIMRGFSIGFNIKKYEVATDDSPLRITDLELIEISVVSSPANVEAVIEQATAKGLTIKALSPKGKGKGAFTMPDPIKLEELQGKVKDVEVTIADVSGKVEKLAKLESAFQDAVKNHKGDTAEIRSIVEKSSGDFKTAIEELKADVASVKKNKVSYEGHGLTIQPGRWKSIVGLSPVEVKRKFVPKDAEQISVLQKLNDEVLLVDAILDAGARKRGGAYSRQDRLERIKGLNIWQDYKNEFTKVIAAGSGGDAGDEWIPTDMSGDLLRDIELATVVTPLFSTVRMPTDPFKVDVFSGSTTAVSAAEKVTIVSAHEQTEQNFVTSVVTFTATKARGRHQITQEMTEKSAVAILPEARRNLVNSIARAKDTRTINGQTGGTHFDTGNSITSPDYRLVRHGLRYYATQVSLVANCGIDMATASHTKWNAIRARLGKYGVSPSQLANIVSLNAYLGHLLNPDEFPLIQTLKDYGPRAVISTGEVLSINSIPVVVSEFMPDNANDLGVVAGATVDRGTSLTVNREMWRNGQYGDVRVYVDFDALWDVYQVVAYDENDFQPVIAPTTAIRTVAYGYNWSPIA